MAKKFLVSPGRCYVVTGPVGTTITAKDGTIVNSIVIGSTQCSFVPSVNEVTINPDTAKLEQVSRGIAVRSSNNGGGGGGGSADNDWITVNDAGEAVLNFPDETNPTIENIKLGYSSFTKVTGTTGGKINCNNFLINSEILSADLTCPKAATLISFLNGTKITTGKVYAPIAETLINTFVGCASLFDAYIYAPRSTTNLYLCSRCSTLANFTFNLAKETSLDFTKDNKIGNVPTLQNVTILDGGLASCTSFIITNSTNLTDASIQNIIDALPAYSGTETSALVSFPPDRLTTEQQTQLSNKGWTWS